MSYVEFPPPPALARHVRLIWQFSGGEEGDDEGVSLPSVQRIVPDGHPELILHFGDPYTELLDGGRAVLQPRALFAGQLTGPLLLQSGHRPGVLGIRFRPAAARAFLGVPMQDLTDRRVPLADLWGLRADALADAITKARNDEERVRHAAECLADQLAATLAPTDEAIDRSAGILLAQDAHASLDTLAADCGLSRRQFERRFSVEVGVSPRLFANVARFRKLFDALEQDTLTVRHWAEAAHAAGYYDQAHMNRDFKRFAGLPPQAFCRTLGGLSAAMVGADAA